MFGTLPGVVAGGTVVAMLAAIIGASLAEMMRAPAGVAMSNVDFSSVAVPGRVGSWRGNEDRGSRGVWSRFSGFLGATAGISIGKSSTPGNVVVDVGESASGARLGFFTFLRSGLFYVSHLSFQSLQPELRDYSVHVSELCVDHLSSIFLHEADGVEESGQSLFLAFIESVLAIGGSRCRGPIREDGFAHMFGSLRNS
jgi:hypothetical protein